MMDQSITRRGQPCYFRLESVNLIAINDSFMLEMAIYYLIKSHFRSEPSYIHLLELFLEVDLTQLIFRRILKLSIDYLPNGDWPTD